MEGEMENVDRRRMADFYLRGTLYPPGVFASKFTMYISSIILGCDTTLLGIIRSFGMELGFDFFIHI